MKQKDGGRGKGMAVFSSVTDVENDDGRQDSQDNCQ